MSRPTATSQTASLNLLEAISLADGLDQPTWFFETDAGDLGWYGQEDFSFDKVDAIQSGAVGDLQTSTISAQVAGPGILSFYWKDYLRTVYNEKLVYCSIAFKC